MKKERKKEKKNEKLLVETFGSKLPPPSESNFLSIDAAIVCGKLFGRPLYNIIPAKVISQ